MNAINSETFLKYLTYYLKLVVYANKGTYNERALEQCIKFYHQYSHSTKVLTRKIIKRFNLVFKTDEQGRPLNLKDKSIQTRMSSLKTLEALNTGRLQDLSLKNCPIYLLPGIPLDFIVQPDDKDENLQKLIWEYTRVLFYITEYIILHSQDVLQKIENLLSSIALLEDYLKIEKKLEDDPYIKMKMGRERSEIQNFDKAKNELKKIFQKQGLNDQKILKMADSITNRIKDSDIQNSGNIVQKMIQIAQDVAHEMKDEYQDDPEKLVQPFNTLTQVFMDTVGKNKKIYDQLPPELRELVGRMTSIRNDGSKGTENQQEKMLELVDKLASTYHLDRQKIIDEISNGENGQIDAHKLEHYFENMFQKQK